jgi:Na+-driven multidrug efflux pump
LRGLGLVKVPTLLQMVSVLVNIVLTPILIEGYITGRPLGIIGAGLSTSIASLVGLVLLLLYFQKQKGSLNPTPHRFHWDPLRWRRILAIGFPAGAEMLMIVAHGSMILWTIAHYGSDAQAGFNVASRINQFFILPALALCHAAPAIVGQNKGSGHPERIRETFRWLSAMAMVVMLSMGAISYIEADTLVSIFTDLAEAKAVAVGYIRIAVTSYFALPLIYASASIFQGYGNAWPPLVAAIVRSIALVIGLGWFTYSGQYTLSDVWWLNVTANLVQAAVALLSIAWLFRTQLRPRLERT